MFCIFIEIFLLKASFKSTFVFAIKLRSIFARGLVILLCNAFDDFGNQSWNSFGWAKDNRGIPPRLSLTPPH